MHIPDGFLDLKTLAITDGIAGACLLFSVWRVNRRLKPERIPLMGLCGAFVFTAQLLSFPVPGGTSVHLCGAVLISILLGPFSGFTILSSALILQALLFHHGGIWSLGANILNMGLIGCWLGYGLFLIFRRILGKYWLAGAGGSAWLSMVISALFASLELWASGMIPLKKGLMAMGFAHIIAGIFEALATILILGTINKIRPDLLKMEKI